ncbi:MAG: ATP-dependent DNA ligase [Candidatus Dormibacteria bacterium]|jgi:ATP-dependent DNA ligase
MSTLTPPLQPMLCRSETEIPPGPGLVYEPKWDGFRCIVFRQGDSIHLESRNSLPLQRYFPELLAPIRAALPDPAVVDGEIVIAGPRGLDFDALQMRLHPAESRVRMLAAESPATFIAFDLLAEGDEDLRGQPLTERTARLRAALIPNPQVALTPQTTDPGEAATWFARYEGAGCDGVVAKPFTSTYRSGDRGWIKVKHLRTVDCVVGGYRRDLKIEAVASLLLGLYDAGGVLHHVGHTASFSAAERRDLLALLRPLEGGTSFGAGRTPGGPSRWTRARDADWVAVRPELVCEVAFDHLQGNRFRHASRFLRWRPDKAAAACGYDQLLPPHPFDLSQILGVGA